MAGEGWLVLEDGRIFKGRAFGARSQRTGEIVFTTAMTGYEEVLTDPSFCGQIVVMTHPHIGNTGIVECEHESHRPWVEGFVVYEATPVPSRPTARWSLNAYLERHQIPGVAEIDTRALVRHIRQKGAMRAVISTLGNERPQDLLEKAKSAPSMIGANLVDRVTTREPYWAVPGDRPPAAWRANFATRKTRPIPWPPFSDPPKEPHGWVVVYDFGVKFGILRSLMRRGLRVLVVSAETKAADILELSPPGVVLSNGPGDPGALQHLAHEVRSLIGRIPLLGICLGHQLLGVATGARTYKLLFGHRGANQPVRGDAHDRVLITTQNHGFAVDPETLTNDIEPLYYHLNDGTLEGFRHRTAPVWAVQFHPEASPGPHEADRIFDEFISNLH